MQNIDLKTLKEKLNRAQVMLKGGSHHQQDEARVLLNEIIEEAPNTPIASQAHDLLIRSSTLIKGTREQKWGQKTRELCQWWAKLQSLAHPEISDFLKTLFDSKLGNINSIARCRQESITELKQWIKKETTTAVRQNETQDWITKRVKVVHENPDFENALNPELKKWQETLFNNKYQEQKAKIHAALEKWLVDEAWRLFDELGSPPTHLQDEVAALKQTIADVGHDARILDKLLAPFEKIPPKMTWEKMRWLAERRRALGEIQPQQTHYPIPPQKEQQRANYLKRFETIATAFLKESANNCQNLQDIRQFWEQYNDTPDLKNYPLEPSWFEEIVEAYKKNNDKTIKLARSAYAIDEIYRQNQNDINKLPPHIKEELETRANAVSTLAETWRTIKTGADFSELEMDIPQAFQNDIHRYRQIWEKLDSISRRIHPATDYPTKEDFQWAKEQLTEILNNYPKHERALFLQTEVLQGIQRFKFDAALRKWELVGFVKVCQKINPNQNRAVRHYLKLAEHKDTLYQLNQLAKAEKLPSMSTAKKWWQQWKQATQALPPPAELPVTFLIQIDTIEEQRENEWFALSETLLTNTQATAEDYHEAANAISICLKHPVSTFRDYYKKFTRKAWHQETEEYIAAKNWQAAQQSLAQFKQSGGAEEEEQRLTTLLEIRQAHANNPSALANILWERWDYVRQYLAQEVSELLYVAIQENWQISAKERLSRLEDLANRLYPKRENMAKPLILWIECLEIERELEIPSNPKKGETEIHFSKAVNQETLLRLAKLALAPTQKKVAAELRKPLERLTKSWQRWPKSLIFIWFYHASQHIQPPLMTGVDDPLDKFTQDSEQRVTQIEATLKNTDSADSLFEKALSTARDQVKYEQKKWQTLKDHFSLLPFNTSREPVKPPSLNDIEYNINNLQSILTELAELENADIREQKNNNKLKQIRYHLTQLKELSTQPALLNRVDTLLSLVSINFPLNRFRDFGKRSGSCAQYDLDTPHLFEEMGNWLKDVIAIFEKAKVVERGMWQRVSQECYDFASQEAGILVLPPGEPDLRNLLKLLKELEDQDQKFQNQIWAVGRAVPSVPTGGKVKCTDARYRPFFNKFPSKKPRTRRSYYHFERLIKVEPCYTILQQCKAQVPEWVWDFFGSTSGTDNVWER